MEHVFLHPRVAVYLKRVGVSSCRWSWFGIGCTDQQNACRTEHVVPMSCCACVFVMTVIGCSSVCLCFSSSAVIIGKHVEAHVRLPKKKKKLNFNRYASWKCGSVAKSKASKCWLLASKLGWSTWWFELVSCLFLSCISLKYFFGYWLYSHGSHFSPRHTQDVEL